MAVSSSPAKHTKKKVHEHSKLRKMEGKSKTKYPLSLCHLNRKYLPTRCCTDKCNWSTVPCSTNSFYNWFVFPLHFPLSPFGGPLIFIAYCRPVPSSSSPSSSISPSVLHHFSKSVPFAFIATDHFAANYLEFFSPFLPLFENGLNCSRPYRSLLFLLHFIGTLCSLFCLILHTHYVSIARTSSTCCSLSITEKRQKMADWVIVSTRLLSVTPRQLFFVPVVNFDLYVVWTWGSR